MERLLEHEIFAAVLGETMRLPIKCNENGTPFFDDSKKYSDEGYVPDWQWMENYIKSLHHKPLTTKNKKGSVPAFDISECLKKGAVNRGYPYYFFK